MSLSPFQLAALKQASHDVLAEATAFLQALIRIDTTNPPGLNYREIATLIADHLSTLDYETQLLAVDKADLNELAPYDQDQHERVNVIGRRKSSSANPVMVGSREKTIHFNGHTDVVGAGDLSTWTHPPFAAEVVDGVIYGRGVSDMKGGLAAGVWAAECVKRAGLVLKGTVEHSGCVDEETTGVRNAGAGWLVEQKHISSETVDAIVITEPLNVDNVCLGHRGALWGELQFHGRASHGATPQRGINSLVHAATFVVRAMESIQKELAGQSDPRVIPEEARGASLTFTVLQSGLGTNSVPDLATLRFDRRIVPSESLAIARAQIQRVLDDMCKEFPDVVYTMKETYHTEPIWVDENLEVCKIWTAAVETALGTKAGIVCSPGSDDQRFFVRGGIPQTIVYGPGDIKNVHNKDEALSLEDLRKSIFIMAIGMSEFLGRLQKEGGFDPSALAGTTPGLAGASGGTFGGRTLGESGSRPTPNSKFPWTFIRTLPPMRSTGAQLFILLILPSLSLAFFDQFFQQQHQQQQAPQRQTFNALFEQAPCDGFLCGTLDCVPKPSLCPCPHSVQDLKCPLGDADGGFVCARDCAAVKKALRVG